MSLRFTLSLALVCSFTAPLQRASVCFLFDWPFTAQRIWLVRDWFMCLCKMTISSFLLIAILNNTLSSVSDNVWFFCFLFFGIWPWGDLGGKDKRGVKLRQALILWICRDANENSFFLHFLAFEQCYFQREISSVFIEFRYTDKAGPQLFFCIFINIYKGVALLLFYLMKASSNIRFTLFRQWYICTTESIGNWYPLT